MRYTLLFLSFIWIIGILLAGCRTLDERMTRYVGEHPDELVSYWGPPSEETKLKKGGTPILYVVDNPLIHPSQHVNPALRICEKIFITDSRGIIQSYSHHNCR